MWFSVAAGGALGALARYGLTLLFTPQAGRFPWATFCANVFGCFLMGALYVLIIEKTVLPLSWRPFLTVGVLGAFTTFSTFSLEAFLLWQHHHLFLAAIYTAATLLVCLLAVWLGQLCCATLFSP